MAVASAHLMLRRRSRNRRKRALEAARRVDIAYDRIVHRMRSPVYAFEVPDRGKPRSLRLVTQNPAAPRLRHTDELLPTRDQVGEHPTVVEIGLGELCAEVAATGEPKRLSDRPAIGSRNRGRYADYEAFPIGERLVAVTMHDVTERRRTQLALRHQATHDPLSGLPNRAMLKAELSTAIASVATDGQQVALLVLDLDRFKEVNDTLGHDAGDHMLGVVAERLRSTVGAADLVARLGGDEFAVMLTNDVTTDRATAVADDIAVALQAPLRIDGTSVQPGVSIGIALLPTHATAAETLLQRADVAMYLAKRAGSPWRLYTAEADRFSLRRLALLGELRGALDRDELGVVYQPKVSLDSGACAGVKALVRWHHPEHGTLFPTEFVELAETSGLVDAMTRTVIRTAILDWTGWDAAGVDLDVAVNLSVRNLHDAELPRWLDLLLREHAFEPRRLILELTESEVMDDHHRDTGVVEQLGAMGVRLAIDDFGTGFSSLSHLRTLPVDEIKIDRSFVANMASSAHDAVVVESIIELGHNLDIEVVAEGVEDRTTRERLAALGCDRAQGFLIHRPLNAEQVVPFVRELESAAMLS